MRSPVEPCALRWRGIIICVVASLVLTLVCLPMVQTVVEQIGLMVPSFGSADETGAIQAAYAACRSDRQINFALNELNTLAQRDPDDQELQAWAAADLNNSLPAWAVLLVELRRAGVQLDRSSTTPRPAASQPATASAPASAPVSLAGGTDNRVRELLVAIESGPPLRLHLARSRDTYVAVMGDHGVDVRRADSVFGLTRWWPVSRGWPISFACYRPILRELADRLIGLGDRYRQLNRPADAARAYAAVIRLLSDAVQDSPLPDVAFLAAERMAVALRLLDAVRGAGLAAGEKPGEVAAAGLERFRQRLVAVGDRDVNLLPVTFGAVLARPEHDRMLRSMSAATAFLAMGWLVALICLVQIGVIVVSRRFGPVPLAWRWGIWGVAAATAIVVVPIIFLILLLTNGWVPYIWLISLPSVGATVAAPAAVLALLVLAAWLCLKPKDSVAQAALPGSVIGGGLLLVLLAALAVAEVVSRHEELWRPPLSVQLFRGIGAIGGLTCVLVLIVWFIWGWRRRRAAGVPAGTWARAGLAVTAPAMVVLLAIAAIMLAVNQSNDQAHKTAFASVLTDPIGNRLGAEWWKEYFEPARKLLNTPPTARHP